MRELVKNRLYVFVEDSFGANQYLLLYPNAWVSIEASVPWSEVQQAHLLPVNQEGKIILTHGHLDHLGRVDEWHQRTQAPVYAHEEERPYFQNVILNGTGMYGQGKTYAEPDFVFKDGEILTLSANAFLEVWHLPGHTLGSSVFLWYELNGEERTLLGLFTGDVLIETSIGRTDFPGGNPSQMEASLVRLKARLEDLPATLPVYCGHGDVLTVGDILKYNPWLRCFK